MSGVDIGAFDPATTEYAADVDHDVTETTVTVTANDGGATYAIKLGGVADDDGIVSLAVGSNVIAVEVTAEDGQTTKTYTVTVTRAAPPSADATLSGLALSGVDIGAFDQATTKYAASVANDVTETTVTPTLNDGGATYVIKLDGTADEDRSIALAVGSNVITVEVTAEDGRTVKTYTITVTRADAGPPSSPPDTPDAPTGEVTGKGRVAPNWNDVEGATYYQVGSWLNGKWEELPTKEVGIVIDGSGAEVSNLPNGSYLYFSVRAGNGAGVSDWSDLLGL